MELKLVRIGFPALATEGLLYIGKVFECFTLELPTGDYGKGCAIPPGRYRVTVNYSETFKRQLPLLLDVPGRSGIRIHTGNGPKQTKGCILVGEDQTTLADAWVGRSVPAFTKLIARIKAAIVRQEEVWITIEETRRVAAPETATTTATP